MTDLYVNLNDDSLVKRIVGLAFPDYRGRKFRIEYGVKFANLTSYWDGGSRDYFALVNVATMQVVTVPANHPHFDRPSYDPRRVEIPAGYVVVKHSILCGKDIGITIMTTNDAPLLPAGNDNMSNDEINVLYAARALKSAYRDAELCRAGLTRQRIDAARNALQRRGYLDKRNAITNAGRNALPPKMYNFIK